MQHTGSVSEAESLLDKAVDELYALDLDQFTPRRTELAKAARTAGDKDAAKAITALRKPTQSAFTINRLARTDPATIDSLVEVGADMRTAQRSADGKQLRELNTQRRRLLDNLTKRAFEIIGQQSPSAGQREEVNATLMAALADPSVAEQLQQGILVRAAESSGFGFSPPELTLIRSPLKPSSATATEPESKIAAPAKRGKAVATEPRTAAKADQADSEPDSAAVARKREKDAEAERRAAAEERRQQAQAKEVARAQAEADAADDAVHAAVAAIDATQQLIRMLQRQLTDARRELEEHQKDAKSAENRQRKAREALNKAKP